MSGFAKSLFIALFVSLLVCENGWTQATAQISGTVRDQTGSLAFNSNTTQTTTSARYERRGIRESCSLL
jgi:hypothetical protein